MRKSQRSNQAPIQPILQPATAIRPATKKLRWQQFWVWVGYVSGALGILVVVFQVGQYEGYRQARRDEFKTFIEYLVAIKDGIRITQVSCDRSKLTQGETCEIQANIENRTPYECSLWMGLSAVMENGKELWNTTEDRQLVISPSGLTIAKRQFTFPTNAVPGKCDIQINLWHGKTSDPKQSERISTAALRQQVVLENR